MQENKELTERLAQMTADRIAGQQEQSEEPVQNDQSTDQSAQESDGPILEPQEVQEAIAAATSAAPQKESGHFKKLREALERSEREKEQLYGLLYKMSPAQSAQTPQQPAEPDLDANDYVPRAYVDKRVREAQEQVAQYQQVLYEQMVANQLKAQYSDFSTVLSSENVARLREEHPEIAASLAANPDIATKAQATYKIMKKLGIGVADQYEPEKQKIQANAQKPRPATASPLSYAHDYEYRRMSDDEMAKERAAMERDIRGG